jgi:hypothetical protein
MLLNNDIKMILHFQNEMCNYVHYWEKNEFNFNHLILKKNQ